MSKRIIIFTIGYVLLFGLFAQKNATKSSPQLYNKANQLYNLDNPSSKTDSIALQLFLDIICVRKVDNKLILQSMIKAGNIHQGYQRFSNANTLYHQALFLNNVTTKDKAVDYEAYLYLGSSHYFNNIIDSAQYYFEAASDIALNYKKTPALAEQDRLYNSLGTIYFESANYLEAKNYFEKAYQLISPSLSNYQELNTSIQSNIANCLIKLNKYKEALAIFKKLRPTNLQEDIITQNTAHAYFELGLNDSAFMMYNKLPLDKLSFSSVAYTDMGRIYMKQKKWQNAERVFDSAILLNKKIPSAIKNKEEAMAYLYRSLLAQEQGFTDEALQWINKSINEIHLNFSPKNVYDLPENISQSVSPITLFNALQVKANLLQKKYILYNNAQYLFASLSCYTKAIETGNFIKLNFDNDEATLFFNENYKSIYVQAIEVAYEAYKLNTAYADDYLFILENYKGNILNYNAQKLQIKNKANIPQKLLVKERELKQLLAFYSTKINQNTNENDVSFLQERYLSIQIELSRLQKDFTKHGNYNTEKYQTQNASFNSKSVQKNIGDQTALLNYFTSNTAIYCLVITKTGLNITKTKIDDAFNSSFTLFNKAIYQYTEGERYEGYMPSNMLYTYLVKPVEKFIKGSTNLVIIPDGLINYIPFDALSKSTNKRHFMIEDYAVSYHYSFALLFQKQSGPNLASNNNSTVAFAPFTDNDSNINKSELAHLPLSAVGLDDFAKNVYSGTKASKQQFITTSNEHSIIHLATHASIGEDSSKNWIQFYPSTTNSTDSKLYLQEIYNLNLQQAELVVLSACETAAGTAVTGEGLLSLSRAFMYAGAQGIVSTLWKTDDKVTNTLMTKMHQYLKQKLPPEKALQLAKIDFLKDKTIGSQYKTPNYWANFIYAGKINEHKNNTSINVVFLLLLLALVPLFIIFYNRNIIKKKSAFRSA